MPQLRIVFGHSSEKKPRQQPIQIPSYLQPIIEKIEKSSNWKREVNSDFLPQPKYVNQLNYVARDSPSLHLLRIRWDEKPFREDVVLELTYTSKRKTTKYLYEREDTEYYVKYALKNGELRPNFRKLQKHWVRIN